MVRQKMDALRVRVLGSPLALALMMAPFLNPRGLSSAFPVLNEVFLWWKVPVALLLAVFFLARPRLTAATVAVGAYYAVAFASTWLHHVEGSSYELMRIAACSGAMCLLVDLAADTDPKALVKGLAYYLGAVCVINLATVVLTRFGIGYYVGRGDNYFLGLDNAHGFFICLMLTVAMLYAWHTRRPPWVQIVLLALFTASVYITWSASSVVAVSVFIALYGLWYVKGSWKVCNIGTYYAVIAVMFLLLVVLRVTDRFAFVIEEVLHKNVDLSGRVPLWARTLPYLLQDPVLGLGVHTDGQLYEILGTVNCHNLFLQVAFDTGVAGSVIYLAALGLLVKPLMRVRKSFGGYMLAAGLFSLLVILQMEALVCPVPFYVLLALCSNGEKVVRGLEPAADEKDAG